MVARQPDEAAREVRERAPVIRPRRDDVVQSHCGSLGGRTNSPASRGVYPHGIVSLAPARRADGGVASCEGRTVGINPTARGEQFQNAWPIRASSGMLLL